MDITEFISLVVPCGVMSPSLDARGFLSLNNVPKGHCSINNSSQSNALESQKGRGCDEDVQMYEGT